MAFDRSKIPRAELLREALPDAALDPAKSGLNAVRCRLPGCLHRNGDRNPSLLVNPATGRFECKVSGRAGNGWKEFTNAFLGPDRWAQVRSLCMGRDPSQSREEAWARLAPEAAWTARYRVDPELSALYLRAGRRYQSDPLSQTAIGLWSTDTLHGVKFRLPPGAEWPDGRRQKYRMLKGDTARDLLFLYDRALPDATVVACAGEKDALVAASHLDSRRWAPVCGCGGEGTLPSGIAQLLADRHVVLALDPDDAGKAGAVRWHDALSSSAASVRVALLPELDPPPGESRWDVAELVRCRGAEALVELLETAGELPSAWVKDRPQPDGLAEERDDRRRSQADLLVELAETVELFRDPDSRLFAHVVDGTQDRTVAIRSSAFAGWLRKRFHEEQGRTPGSSAVSDAVKVLEGRAEWGTNVQAVHLRVARLDGRIILDLANEAGEVIEVTAAGWRVLDTSPARFLRPRGMRELPRPEPGGTLEELRPLLNIPSQEAWTLLKGWLAVTLSGRGPYFVLVLQGEQGSAKSTTARMLRSLIDPGKAGLRAPPRDERDLVIAAQNGHVIAYDNLSGIKPWLSDALCRVATGSGFGTRQLYSNDEEQLFEFARPITINGIDDMLGRADLADRSVVLQLPRVSEEQRKDEATLWAHFERARPRALGALLDAVAAGLANIGRVAASRYPRMADATKWVIAAETGLKIPRGEFLAALRANRTESVVQGLEAEPIAEGLRIFMAQRSEWVGTAAELSTELADALMDVGSDLCTRGRGWPANPSMFGRRLNRKKEELRFIGIDVDQSRGTGGRRLWRITNRSFTTPVPPAPPATQTCRDGRRGAWRHEPASLPHPQRPGREGDEGRGTGETGTALAPQAEEEDEV